MAGLRENIKNLLNKDGGMRGEFLIAMIDFIERKEGEEGLSRLISVLHELDSSLDLNKISPTDWVDVSIGSAVIVMAKDLFDWSEETIEEMGIFTGKAVSLNKIMLRDAINKDILLDELIDHWEKIMNVGNLKVEKREEKRAELILSQFDYLQEDFIFLTGYFKLLFNLCTEKELTIERENLEEEEVCKFIIIFN